MALKSNSFYYAIGILVLLLGGCKTTKNIDEKYLVINKISIADNGEDHSTLALKIQGEYGESAWGIKSIRYKMIGDAIILNGTLEFGGEGAFEYIVRIPSHIDIVKFDKRTLWVRSKKMQMHSK